ncbi:MAG TPA: hypothetical protein VMO26_25880 [Vicinamibacterales bacterium]|nr:hypothetical protein [Vicinamibacterales bacterium]
MTETTRRSARRNFSKANERVADHRAPESGDVKVVTTVIGPDQYRIVATATFESAPADVWALLSDWEGLVTVGLPGLTSDFAWLTGGPDQVPSTFQFVVAGSILKEEIYERTAAEAMGRYRLRYRALEPALGVVEYDAVIELQRVDEVRTAFSAERQVRLAPGDAPDTLAGMVESETRCLKEYFAA